MLLVLFHLNSCRIDKELSPIPSINLLDSKVLPYPDNQRDSLIIINLTYRDDDGDIGFPENDTSTNANLFVSFFEWINGAKQVYVSPLSGDTLHFNERITSLTPTGKNKSISGTITLRIPAIIEPGYSPDSVIFQISLTDRQNHRSNEVTTQVFRIRH